MCLTECTFKLAHVISFIEPSERDLIEKIITLGFYYRKLDRFATKSCNLSWIRYVNVSPLERPAELSKGSAILHIEQKLLSETLLILATFFVLLPPLYELVLEIEGDDIRGGKLLNILHKQCHCGVSELQACIQSRCPGFLLRIISDRLHSSIGVMAFAQENSRPS
ncbi:hypothetical protein Ddye_016984 [Dipteronia dyeriana]|uniref:Gamma-tubulin complex component n=1 Tax=Dipteronia dyeriana TaxID=168575 RepID=A0AAD9U8Q4_9ROSI|nr:hypothetical protein Ddye_016984 [Dipteronia dyeriana]